MYCSFSFYEFIPYVDFSSTAPKNYLISNFLLKLSWPRVSCWLSMFVLVASSSGSPAFASQASKSDGSVTPPYGNLKDTVENAFGDASDGSIALEKLRGVILPHGLVDFAHEDFVLRRHRIVRRIFVQICSVRTSRGERHLSEFPRAISMFAGVFRRASALPQCRARVSAAALPA